jgi:simple sugar transport system ATP-binding protein
MASANHARAAPGGPPVAQTAGVTKRYGPTVALDAVDITVERAETHGLVGRNGAGKSTLVALLTGLQRPDLGTIQLNGEPAPSFADRQAWRRRVACVYQHSTIIPTLTVAENLYLNRQNGGPAGSIQWSRLRDHARSVLAEWDVDVDVRRPAGDLSVEQRQMVEIARALSIGARFIILDEPTAQLDAAGIERLFSRIRALKASGVAFLFISHHLQEVYEICETVTVFRDARRVLTSAVEALPHGRLVEAMTGEAVGLMTPSSRRPATADEAATVLEIRGLSLPGLFEDVSVSIRAGEVVGLAGSGGSGKVALAESVAGLRAPRAGDVAVDGCPVPRGRVDAALQAGIGFVPQDRRRQGLVPLMSVAENSTMTLGEELGPWGAIRIRKRKVMVERMITDLGIKTSGPDQQVADLSGGNQQKVVMARALATRPRALVLVAPTAGVDVRSKESLLGIVDSVAERGTAVLLVSDELEELRRCDRVLVMFRDRVVHELASGWSDAEMVAAMEGIDGRTD